MPARPGADHPVGKLPGLVPENRIYPLLHLVGDGIGWFLQQLIGKSGFRHLINPVISYPHRIIFPAYVFSQVVYIAALAQAAGQQKQENQILRHSYSTL